MNAPEAIVYVSRQHRPTGGRDIPRYSGRRRLGVGGVIGIPSGESQHLARQGHWSRPGPDRDDQSEVHLGTSAK